MPVWRAAAMVSGFTLLNLNVTTCRSNTDAETVPSAQPEPMSVELKEVDTAALTQREKKDWSAQMSSLLAPCPDTPVNLNQCISEKRDCAACLPECPVNAIYRDDEVPEESKGDITANAQFFVQLRGAR